MKYIEENENITREYEVTIDDAELEKIIKELNEKCCRAVKKTVRVTSGSKEEAIKKINSSNNHGISVVREIELTDDFKYLKSFSKPQYIYECEFYFNQISYLEYLLSVLLSSYRSKSNYVANNNRAIKLLIDYENNEELKTYEERMAEHGITPELFSEYENNKDFDFELLKNLYQRAKECVRLVLLSEVIHYSEESEKVYKLGER